MLPVWSSVRKTWTVFLIFQLQMICIRGDCGLPPVIEHTLPVEQIPGVEGATVVYKCDRNTGYYESPGKSNTITCQDDKTWSTLPEFCARGCGVPERLRYAVLKSSDLEKDIFLPGTSVSYDCREGYKRVPRSNTSITCLDNFTWSTPSKFCVRKECGHPGEPENGYFEATEQFLFGSRVTYMCNEGYRLMSRRPYRECQANGKWTNDVPQCEVVVCPAPIRPDNGMYNPEKDEYSYSDAVTFTCNKGFHAIGESTASCTSDGTWSINSPNCKVVNCPDPGPVQNGRRMSGFVGPYTLNSAVRYECENNFVMNGSSLITCNVDSQWEPENPKCLTISCGDPGEVMYAKRSSSEFTHGSRVNYICQDGYKITSSISYRECQADGRWSSGDIVCSAISCGDPGEVMYAKRLSSEFTYGSRVTYICQDGYKITSSITYRECQADGSWSPGDIVCSETHRGLSSGAVAGIIIGCLLAVIAACLLCWCCSKKKSGEYFCENKNDKFKQTVEQELIESNNKKRKPVSETLNVQYTACNDA